MTDVIVIREPEDVIVIREPEVERVYISQPLVTTVSGRGNVYTYQAGQNISALRCVSLIDNELYYADPNSADSVWAIVGVSVTAGLAGGTVQVMTHGVLLDANFNFVPKQPVWVDVNGVLTQTQPDTEYFVRVGRAISQTEIVLNIEILLRR